MKTLFTVLFSVFFFTLSAQVLLEENFNYELGDLEGQG